MQRRSFLRNAACVGACASLFAPIEQVFAADAAASVDVDLRFDCLERGMRPDASASMQLRVSPQSFVDINEPLRVRAWFATEEGVHAFDLASFGRSGSSQRLRFVADTRRLVGFEVGDGQHFDDCSPLAGCRSFDPGGAAIGPGRYRLALHRNGERIAAVELEVSVATA